MLGWRVREAFLANRSGDPCIATAESAGFCEKEDRIGRLRLKLRDFWREGLGCGDCQRQGQVLGTLADGKARSLLSGGSADAILSQLCA